MMALMASVGPLLVRGGHSTPERVLKEPLHALHTQGNSQVAGALSAPATVTRSGRGPHLQGSNQPSRNMMPKLPRG